MATLTPSVSTLATSAASDAADAVMIRLVDFEAIFLRFQGPLTHFIARALGNQEQARDLAQDVFVKVYKALRGGTVIPQRALAVWLYRITANTIIDTLRRQRPWLPLSLFDEDREIGADVLSTSMGTSTVGFPTSDDERGRPGRMTSARLLQKQGRFNGGRFEERVAERQIIEGVFGQMSPKYGACLWLYEHEGLSCSEIAETLHISVSATKMRLLRAREQFLTLYRRETGE